jgi:GPH family glycoside/pentoside/hexuronide:cation symporter
MAMSISQLFGAALWTLLVRKFEKTTLLAVGHALNMVGILGFACAGRDLPLLIGCAGLIGMGLASVFMLPLGLLADVVDFSEYRHRERREPALFAAYLVLIKASGVASLSFCAWVMAYLHYIPGVIQTPMTISGVKMLAYGVPLIASFLSIILVTKIPIGHRRHVLVLKALERRARNGNFGGFPTSANRQLSRISFRRVGLRHLGLRGRNANKAERR